MSYRQLWGKPRIILKKNKCQTRFGQIEIAHNHRFKAKTNGFFITPHLQELMALAGVSDVYSASNNLFKAFLGIDLSASQVYRVSTVLGHQITLDLDHPVDHPDLAEGEVIYGSMDGSMLLPRRAGRSRAAGAVKVGRIFSSKSRQQAGQKGDEGTRFKLTQSIYCAHLGSSPEFIAQFEASLGTYKASPERLVFVTDGGVWIQHYLEEAYPKATHILDYYHAVEHLAEFSRVHFKAGKDGGQWLDRQKYILLTEGVDGVLTNLAALPKLSALATESRRAVVGYYSRNRHRMAYADFRGRGLQRGRPRGWVGADGSVSPDGGSVPDETKWSTLER